MYQLHSNGIVIVMVSKAEAINLLYLLAVMVVKGLVVSCCFSTSWSARKCCSRRIRGAINTVKNFRRLLQSWKERRKTLGSNFWPTLFRLRDKEEHVNVGKRNNNPQDKLYLYSPFCTELLRGALTHSEYSESITNIIIPISLPINREHLEWFYSIKMVPKLSY